MSTLCWLYNIQSAYHFLRETDLLYCYSLMVSKNALGLKKKSKTATICFFLCRDKIAKLFKYFLDS